MTVTFSIPEGVEADLRHQLGDLGQAAKEALAIEGYRNARLSVGQVAWMLGMGVVEAQAWLSTRGAPLNYSLEDLEEDRKTLAALFGNAAR